MECILFGVDHINKIGQPHGKKSEHSGGHYTNNESDEDCKCGILEQLIGGAETADQSDHGA